MRTSHLCNYALATARRYSSAKISNTSGSIFDWTDFWGLLTLPFEAAEAGQPEELDIAATAVSFLYSYVGTDFDQGGLDKEMAR